MNSDICEYMAWDSDFFGVRIGRANTNQLNKDSIEQIQAWCQEHSIDCLYFLAVSNDPKTIRIAEDHNFNLVEVRLTSKRNLNDWNLANYPSKNPHIRVRSAKPEDIPILQEISEDIYIYSRYFVDGRFDQDKCQRFYQIWVKNNYEAPNSLVLVGEIDNQVQGYLTCRKSDLKPQGQFEIMGIRKEYQQSGIGYEILRSGIEWFFDQGMDLTWFITQGSNIPVHRLAQPFGFIISNCQLYYHRWFTK